MLLLFGRGPVHFRGPLSGGVFEIVSSGDTLVIIHSATGEAPTYAGVVEDVANSGYEADGPRSGIVTEVAHSGVES